MKKYNKNIYIGRIFFPFFLMKMVFTLVKVGCVEEPSMPPCVSTETSTDPLGALCECESQVNYMS
jgi:hypothetical protein